MTRELPETVFGYCPVCASRGWFDKNTDQQCKDCGVRFRVTDWKEQ